MIKHFLTNIPFLFSILFLLILILGISADIEILKTLSYTGQICLLCYLFDIKHFFDIGLNRFICARMGHNFSISPKHIIIVFNNKQDNINYKVCERCKLVEETGGTDIFTH